MRDVVEYMIEVEGRLDLLLDEKFDKAFLGTDSIEFKPMYDAGIIAEIYESENKNIEDMCRDLYEHDEEKPIYLQKYDIDFLKISRLLKKM